MKHVVYKKRNKPPLLRLPHVDVAREVEDAVAEAAGGVELPPEKATEKKEGNGRQHLENST